MNKTNNIENRISKTWELDKLSISHNVIDYKDFGRTKSRNDSDLVRLHFGLHGSYQFNYTQLGSSFDLSGSHNNIMYSEGLEIEVENRSQRIETFGINFTSESFIEIAQNGNEPLKRFADKVLKKENSILSNHWKTNNFKIQQVIKEILDCPYQQELKDLFLLSKSIELLVLQADLYQQEENNLFIKTTKDRDKLIEAKELLNSRIDNPPTITELSKLSGINEYKLKKGFKELFGTTIFGYIHKSRMSLAKKLLLGTDKSAKEIAYQTGYNSPQHFSTAFKKEYGISPNSVRVNPDSVITQIEKKSNLDF
ncbi:AraC family transcriptional regulator [Mangrovivirga sp. M17]|uniref:AraC family transcriptional regulator n=1 Tax=Mangrovivirga halotolerans TaxID=2993936 RepID=A0ABT3RUM2_9BACT|nr:AraC family transcriptional regulator [Mangrovivirga halotolerans]MCX2745335.1 AraC family transcriptional regulator [Mangrovivirga halotolerans]